MSGRKKSLFLERRTYRRRRLMDAARLLPLLGTLLLVVPVLMHGGQGPASLATAGALIYFFAVWLGLVVASAALSWLLVHGEHADGEP